MKIMVDFPDVYIGKDVLWHIKNKVIFSVISNNFCKKCFIKRRNVQKFFIFCV